jgi:hypothetical protein
MRKVFCISILVILSGSLSAQTKNTRDRNASRTVFEGQPSSVRLAPHVTTTIRLPEPVNSVVLGDSNLFQAEYSPNEPLLVFARPTASAIAETNMVISTVFGRQFILLLRSVGASAGEGEPGVDLLVTCQVAQVRFIEETFPSALISETVNLGKATPPNASDKTDVASESELALDEILNRQRHRRIEKLYGEGIRVGIGQIAQDGSRWIVSFSVMSSKSEAAELVPPQVQLSGQTKAGIFRRSHWTTVQQVPVQIYRLSSQRLNPGGRADGVVVFERPPIQQSTEKLMLQIADSAAVDQPVLAPIHFRQTQPLEKNHE